MAYSPEVFSVQLPTEGELGSQVSHLLSFRGVEILLKKKAEVPDFFLMHFVSISFSDCSTDPNITVTDVVSALHLYCSMYANRKSAPCEILKHIDPPYSVVVHLKAVQLRHSRKHIENT